MCAVVQQCAPRLLRSWSIPLFLCPALRTPSLLRPAARSSKSWLKPPRSQTRQLYIESSKSPAHKNLPVPHTLGGLPWTCPGCGAYSQASRSEEAGFYTATRRSVKAFLDVRNGPGDTQSAREAEVFREALDNADPRLLQSLGIEEDNTQTTKAPVPVCDRCHSLLHHSQGASIVHPTLQSIRDTMSESPYKYNHVYHVLDAADFPLSLIPQLQRHLSLSPQRGRNRRSKSEKFYGDRKADMSFIITRSDLLAPKKEQVDAMMPYLLEVLRDALGSAGEGVRLGNVRCVSSMRGWWTKQMKEDIWNRGGGGWMVGKVNVGKSSLFEQIFPKARNQEISSGALGHTAGQGAAGSPGEAVVQPQDNGQPSRSNVVADDGLSEEELSDDFSLLPPAPAETAFPVMPLVSHLPGTTASPIRLPFGSGKGELVDLPGLSRGNLERCVKEEHRASLVMRSRIKAKQVSIKPGQSLLLGNLIRITPNIPSDAVFLASPFVPIEYHVTNTEKAAAIQAQEASSPAVTELTNPGVGAAIASAGVYALKWDVTKERSGPLTAPAAVGLKAEALPFVIYSTDILIEGCGWVEMAVQVRKRALEAHAGSENVGVEALVPTIEVFSPNGRHVGARKPMGAFLIGGRRRKPASQQSQRPRRSMKGAKKAMKRSFRASQATSREPAD